MHPTTENPSPAVRSAKRLGPLINRDFALLWGGQLISSLGDFVFDTTLVVWIAAQLAVGQPWAPLAVSGVLVAATAPILLVGPLAGVFADRWDKRRTLLAMDALRAILILLLVLAADVVPLPFTPGGRLPLEAKLGAIYVIVFLASTCAQFFNPARSALIAHIVDDEHQPQASGLSQIAFALSIIVGPPIAAPLLFAFGVQWALLINALSFVVSFLAISAIRVPHAEAQPAATGQRGVLREFGAGLRFYFTNRILVTVLVAGLIAGLGAGALNALDIFFFTDNLHTTPELYGFAGAAYAAGTLFGAVLGSVFARRIGLLRLVWISLLWLGLGIVVYSRMTSFAPAMAVLFVTGIPQATLNIAIGPVFLRVTPRHLLGRVMAVLNPAMTVVTLISTALSGYLASAALRDFSASFSGVTFGTLDTLFGVAGLLVVLGGLYVLVNFRGVTLPPAGNGSPSEETAPVPAASEVTHATDPAS